jgi:hypothetical protein
LCHDPGANQNRLKAGRGSGAGWPLVAAFRTVWPVRELAAHDVPDNLVRRKLCTYYLN